jgi:GR25 family glycosyltransferase involved in LPS biosynthesis
LLSAAERERLAPRSALLLDRELTPGEIGAAASHFAIVRKLAEEDHDFVCVMEDDAVPLTADLGLFLQQQTLRALPSFDVLRMLSDPERWKRPSWQVAHVHGRSICAMARVGWGLQGIIYSRNGLRKISSQLGAIRAPIDFMFFHDCHIRHLRVFEVRPGLLEYDDLHKHPELQRLTDTGLRPAIDVRTLSSLARAHRNFLRQRRKFMALTSFIQVWGLSGLFRILSSWPPWGQFR